MIINSIVLFVCVFFLFYNYKATVVAIAPIIPYLDNFVMPFSYPGGGKVFALVSLFALLLLPFKVPPKKIIANKYPFKLMTVFVVVSYMLSNIPMFHPAGTVNLLLTVYIYPVLLWICINSPDRLKLFVNVLIFSLSLFVIYGFYEVITSSNPVMNYFVSHGIVMQQYSEGMRFGLKRLQSFAPYIGAAGTIAGMGFVTLLLLKRDFNKLFKLKNRIYLLLVGLFLCVFFTGTRSVILGFAVGLFAFVDFRYIAKKKVLMVMLVSTLMSLFFYQYTSGYIEQIIDSFTDTESVRGSSQEMRRLQWIITKHYWKISPVIGNGFGFMFYVVSGKVRGIYGAESVWFPLFTDFGLLGCTAFILTIIMPIIKLIKMKLKPIVFLILLFLVNKTFSSIPGISIGFHLIFVVFFVRLKEMVLGLNR
nr:O-antigen ligase family protein [uncultured Desulfobacter sp.]